MERACRCEPAYFFESNGLDSWGDDFCRRRCPLEKNGWQNTSGWPGGMGSIGTTGLTPVALILVVLPPGSPTLIQSLFPISVITLPLKKIRFSTTPVSPAPPNGPENDGNLPIWDDNGWFSFRNQHKFRKIAISDDPSVRRLTSPQRWSGIVACKTGTKERIRHAALAG